MIAPVLFDGLGAPFEEVGEDAGAEDRMEVIVTGDGEVVKEVENGLLADSVVWLGAEELDVLEGSIELEGSNALVGSNEPVGVMNR